MPSHVDTGAPLRRLRWLLGLLFLGLAIPAGLLIRQGFVQIELAEFRRQQLIAEELVRSIDSRLSAAIAIENARPATDFDYATQPPEGAGNVVQLSPLSSLAAASAFPGTIGYFQVDAVGQLSTPLLPTTSREALPVDERVQKTNVEDLLADVLEANRLVETRERPAAEQQQEADRQRLEQEESAAIGRLSPSAAIRGQAAFDELASINEAVPELRLDSADVDQVVVTGARVAANAPAEEAAGTLADAPAAVSVTTFAGDLEPLRFSLLETGHLVLFRNAWRNGERFVQGLLVDRASFIDQSIEQAFVNASFAAGTLLNVSAAGNTLTTLDVDNGAGRVDGSALYAARLSPPLADIEIALQSGVLERGPGFSLLVWTTIALAGVLVGGFFAMYRFSVEQLRLARQQQNFVSAVSHELKTPLTSIRMYGEMLKSGWADDQKKQTYYEFIFDEGERLSRLIDNVLQLARLNESGPAIAMEPVAVGELMDVIRSKLSTQAERAGFELKFAIAPEVKNAEILADIDALTQVFINLIDNAIKFSGETATREIIISARGQDKASVLFTVRDFGPGIPAAAMKRLFELFYRPDNELTRTTAGTGIGLALVRQFVSAMSGRVDVKNQNPGAEFRLTFPLEHVV
jgi:signal transduction histidine kinase